MHALKSRVVLFVISMFVWSLLNWLPDWQHLLVGVFVSCFVAFMTGDLFSRRPDMIIHFRRYVYFVFVYVPVLLWECIKANVDVAYRIIHPRLPINPGIVKVKTSLQSDIALTVLANSITLTPGTMTVDIDEEEKTLYIHWINVKDKDVEASTKYIVNRFERVLTKVFE